MGALQNTVAGLTPGAAATTTQSTNGFSSDISNLYGLTGRSPDAAGSQYWQGVVNSQGLTSAFNQFAATPEAQGYAASNPAGFVAAEYQTELNRTPDAAGAAFWQGQLTTLGPAKEAQAFSASAAKGK